MQVDNEGTVVTEDTYPEQQPDTVSEEAIVDELKDSELPDEQFNEALPAEIKVKPSDEPKKKVEKEAKLEADDKSSEETQADPVEGKADRKHKTFVRDKNGHFILTRADGSKIELAEDEVSGIASRRVQRIVAQREALAQEVARLQQLTTTKPEPVKSEPAKTETTTEKVIEATAEPDWETGEWESLSEFNKAWYDWRVKQDKIEAKKEVTSVSEPSKGELLPKEEPAQPAAPPEYLVKQVRDIVEDGVYHYGQNFVTEVVNNSEAPFDLPFLDLVAHTTDKPYEVLWGLAHDLEKARSLRETMQNEGPILAAREIGRYEARLEALPTEEASSPEEPPRVTPRRSAAPPPTPVIKSRGSVGPTRSIEALAQNQKDYERWRKENSRR